jgi:hypothetical protein
MGTFFEATESPAERALAGDHFDDDAEVLDSRLAGPDEIFPQSAGPYDDEPTPKMPSVHAVTQLLAQTYALNAAWDPVFLLPADPDRKTLVITVRDMTAPETCRLASDRANLMPTNSNCLSVGNGIYDLSGHTGPLYLYAPDAVSGGTISLVAVTS